MAQVGGAGRRSSTPPSCRAPDPARRPASCARPGWTFEAWGQNASQSWPQPPRPRTPGPKFRSDVAEDEHAALPRYLARCGADRDSRTTAPSRVTAPARCPGQQVSEGAGAPGDDPEEPRPCWRASPPPGARRGSGAQTRPAARAPVTPLLTQRSAGRVAAPGPHVKSPAPQEVLSPELAAARGGRARCCPAEGPGGQAEAASGRRGCRGPAPGDPEVQDPGVPSRTLQASHAAPRRTGGWSGHHQSRRGPSARWRSVSLAERSLRTGRRGRWGDRRTQGSPPRSGPLLPGGAGLGSPRPCPLGAAMSTAEASPSAMFTL